MRGFLKTLLTGKDNASGDIGRVLWVFFSVALVAHEGYAVSAQHLPFDPVTFASACGALLVGGGAALGLKAKTEPEGT